MATLADIEALLAKEGILFKPNQGGVVVTEVDDGFLLHRVNADAENRNFTKAQIEAILRAFPHLSVLELERFLVRNTESARRAIMLEERRKSSVYSDFRSLDPDRPLPAKADARNPGEIPRLYSALEASSFEVEDKSSPTGKKTMRTLAVWGSEFPVPQGGVRLDEAMFLVDIDEDDAKRIQAGEDPRDVLRNKTVRNARVLYYDDNKVLAGKGRLEHHLKSIDSLESWLRHVVGALQVQIVGEIFGHVEDDFVDSPAVRVTDSEGAVERRKPGQEPSGKPVQRFFLSLRWKPEFVNGVLVRLRTVRDSRTALFIAQMSKQDRKTVLRKLRDVAKVIQQSLATALKSA